MRLCSPVTTGPICAPISEAVPTRSRGSPAAGIRVAHRPTPASTGIAMQWPAAKEPRKGVRNHLIKIGVGQDHRRRCRVTQVKMGLHLPGVRIVDRPGNGTGARGALAVEVVPARAQGSPYASTLQT
ncbi:hypothetical protein CUJ84_Chr002213 [Rhizobium leguminosarum]|uniref:Uncharacterized protein n=1 Tax=Rhizobium leguminosarum TaxID=384 RepID=A0A2K9Z2Z1_RHILE|nr:hypothetical protein CUJ84_Chr002213 [Rhizobium leguminosarum]